MLTTGSLILHQNNKLLTKKYNLSAKHPHKQSSVPLGMAATTCESLDSKDPLDYSYPIASSTTNTSVSSNKGEAGGSAEVTFTSNEDTLYHVVGPNVRHGTTDNTSIDTTALPTHPPPVPAKYATGHKEHFYHVLGESLEDSLVLYEEPIPPKFRVS